MFFFLDDPATTEIYTLSLHDALPISRTPVWTPGMTEARQTSEGPLEPGATLVYRGTFLERSYETDRKSTRLNSSHPSISYAVFCLKKKKNKQKRNLLRSQEETS